MALFSARYIYEFHLHMILSFYSPKLCISIRHLHISHNTRCLLAKILHNLCFSFLLGIIAVQREIENNVDAKFYGANKVHFGSGELSSISLA